MATGVSAKEQHSEDSKTAQRKHGNLPPLPNNKTKIELSYSGKSAEEAILKPLETSFLCLNKRRENTNITANALVLSDNIFALHHLIKSNLKAKLIYLDPPYATGKDFQSRQLEHAYNDSFGPATYIEFMRRRLILMRELLSDEGSIYVHIGHQQLFHLKAIMDEIFGAKNFRNLIIRRKCSSKNFTKNQYPNLNDYILFYSKTQNYTWNKPGEKPSQEWINKEYTKKDARGRYKLVPVHAPGTRHGETGKSWRGKKPPPGKHWQYAPSKLDELDENGDIYWSKTGNPRRKVYLSDDKMISLTDYWHQFRDAHHQSIAITGYPTEKNFNMMKTIVSASSNEGDLVIDPFCGSGTTLHAAEELNRNWIGIDESYAAIKASLGRLKYGLNPMGDYVNKSKEKNISSLFSPDFDFYVDSEINSNEIENMLDL